MSSSDSDDCYGSVTKKLQNLKNKYHEDQIDTANLLNVSKESPAPTQEKGLGSETVVLEDLEDDDLILDQIIALNSIQRTTRNSTRGRARKSVAGGSRLKNDASLENSTDSSVRNTRSRSALNSSVVVLDSPVRARGRGRRKSGGRRARRAMSPSYPCFSVGNTYEYPDESHNIKLFTTKPKETNLDDSLTIDDNEELSIKVFWQSSDIIKFTIRKFQKLTQIYEFFSKKENVSIDKLLFTYNDKILKAEDTPDSINYSIAKFIDGGIVRSHIPTLENNVVKENGIKIKFQCQNLKKPIEITVQAGDSLQKAFVRCAEHLEVPVNKLRFEFDGDSLAGSMTASDLELEGGECIDVKIMR